MLNLRNEKLNTVLNQLAANVANLVGREIRRSNKNGMILAVDIVDFEDHVINLWFANASTAVEKRASDFQVWSTFMHVLCAKEKLAAKSIRSEHGNYVQFTTLEELPSVSFEFDATTLNFTPSGLAPKAFISDLRNFVNTMSRRPFSEQAWFEKNFPTASNFAEALITMLRNHDVTVKQLFADTNEDVVELSKILVSKLVQHKIYKEDLIQGIMPTEAKVDEAEKVSQKADPVVRVVADENQNEPTDFGAKLSAALKEVEEPEVEEPEVEAESVETVTEAEVEAEVVAGTQDTEQAEIELQEIFSDLTKYHAAPKQGKQRKQVIRSLSRVPSMVENSELLITLLDILDLKNEEREEFRGRIHSAMSLSVVVEETESIDDELDSIADEFESEEFDAQETDEAQEEEGDEDELDSFEYEEDEDDNVEFSEEDEDEVEAEESSTSTEAKDVALQELISQGKARLRARARKLGMPLGLSCSSDAKALAEFIYEKTAA